MSEKYFPTNTCVLACSGPSLNKIDPFSLGLPVVAVSTVIRKITNPDFWIIADYLNEMHGPEGSLAYSNPNIIKVLPEGKISVGAKPESVVSCKYDTSTRYSDLDAHLFTGHQPFIRGPHKSVTFAIQWLHYIGVKNVIWVGNDLKANSMKEKYCYEVKDFDMKKAYNYDKTLDQTSNALKQWYPIAIKRGYKWFSWECGEIFESFVPKFDLQWWESEGKEQLKQYAPITFPLIEFIPPQPKQEPKQEVKPKKPIVQIRENKKVDTFKNPNTIEKKVETIPIQKVIKQDSLKPSSPISERRDSRRRSLDVKKQLRNNK